MTSNGKGRRAMETGETHESVLEENARLREENANLKRVLAKVYILTSEEVMHLQRTPTMGRPHGSTRTAKEDFVRNLWTTYSQLPPDKQTREHVAGKFGVSKRTFNRYLARWAVPWPPVDGQLSVQELVEHQQGGLRAARYARARAERLAAGGVELTREADQWRS